MNFQRLGNDLRNLSYVYPLALDDDCSSIIIKEFNTPPGYNYEYIDVLLELPKNYPEEPPGVGKSNVYVPNELKYRGKEPEDFHKFSGPSEKWAWWCYLEIDWKPSKDNLITFFELLRANMTNPKTKGFSIWNLF